MIKATGYKYEEIHSSIPQSNGHVANHQGYVHDNVYCVGWNQTGPKGVIAAALMSTQVAFERFRKDIDREDVDDDVVTNDEDIAFVGGVIDY